MDDLVQHVVRELSFEGDFGKPLVLHLIGGRLGAARLPHHAQVWEFDSRRRPFYFLV